jgi:DNA-binding NarL/FixJ family response regulator
VSAEAVIKVLCADDHPLVRKGMASILANEEDMQLVAEAGNGREAVQKFRELKPDVVLMDLRMPEMDGVEATREIRKEAPDARIIALTSYDGDQDIYRAIEAGVRGYILKEMVHTKWGQGTSLRNAFFIIIIENSSTGFGSLARLANQG